MKLSTLIFAGTITSVASIAGVQVQGQSVDQLHPAPTRLPSVNAKVVSNESVKRLPRVAKQSRPSVSASPASHPWLQSTTAIASSGKAFEKLEQAKVEFHSKAWLSAEQSTWESISLFSQAIDLRGEGIDASNRLRIAKDAILEARDFGGIDGAPDPDAILRLAKSHRTQLITANDATGLTAAAAADCYLDLARRNLAPIAASDPQCAEAIDFLAAIYLGRDEPKQLPGETALCLRRAALQGQPANADLAARLGVQLADVGLVEEAKWAMEHSLQIQFQPVVANRLASLMRQTGQHAAANQWADQIRVRSRFNEGAPAESGNSAYASAQPSALMKDESAIVVPVITQLSPSQFASVSKPVMRESSRNAADSLPTSKPIVPVSFASARLDNGTRSQQTEISASSMNSVSEVKKASPVRRWFQSIKSPWKGDSE